MSLKIDNIQAILAVDSHNGIAKNGYIPWKSKIDMEFFKNKTTNNIIIMGSKTLLSLPNSQPLKNRKNIVITNNIDKFSKIYTNCGEDIIFVSLKQVLEFMQNYKDKNTIFIIGGNQIFQQLIPYCSIIWLTKIKHNYDCDLMFDYDISTYTKEVIYEDPELEIMYLK